MADDFLQGIQVGSGLVNTAWQRQERMMQLRSLEALRQVQERETAAQAEMVTQHAQLYMQQQQMQEQKNKERQAYLASSLNLIHDEVQKAGGDVTLGMQNAFPALNALSPELADQATTSYSKLIAPQLRLQGQLGTASIRADTQRSIAEQGTQRALGVQELRNQGAANVQQMRNLGNGPKQDPIGYNRMKQKEAMEAGDQEAAALYGARLAKLVGTAPSPALKEANDLADAKAQLDRLNQQASGLPEQDPALETQRKRLQAVVDSMEARHGQEEISVSTPGGPEVRITKGGQKQPFTKAEESRYGEDMQATGNALRVLGRLSGEVQQGAVGVGPKIQHAILDEYLGQLDSGLVDKSRSAARQDIGIATQQVLGELNNQGRMSVQELHAIQAAMPSLGMAESPANAQVKLNQLRLTLAEKGAAAAVTLNRPVRPEVLQTLSELFPGREGATRLAAEVKQGALSADVARQVIKWQRQQTEKK